MNVSELFNLTHWITREIVDKTIPQKYQELLTILQKNSQPNQQKSPLEDQKTNLINVLENVPLEQLTHEQLDFLDNLGIAQRVGEQGKNAIEDVLYKNVIDIATSFNKLNEMLQKINQGITKSNQLKSSLTGFVVEEKYEEENEILMRVSFTGNATMKNIVDFKDWGDIWHDIGRGIAMVHDRPPEEIKIVGATKGSIIIELAVISIIAKTVSEIMLSVLKVVEKTLAIKKKAEELRDLKMKNSKIANDLDKEAETEKKSGIEEISKEVKKRLSAIDGEKITALENAVKKLIDFMEKGGNVDCVIPKAEEVDGEGGKEDKNAELRIAFEEIRKLERKISLLEHTPPYNAG